MKCKYNYLDGKYNSTEIKAEKAIKIKDEPNELTDSGNASKNWVGRESYYSSEYSSSFNPADTTNESVDSDRQTDPFPMPLNSSFDLHALVMVR